MPDRQTPCVANSKTMLITDAIPSIIVRTAPVDGAVQILFQGAIWQRVLFLDHYKPLAGTAGITKQYNTLRSTIYWPTMLDYIRWCFNNFHKSTREQIQLRKHETTLQLFLLKKDVSVWVCCSLTLLSLSRCRLYRRKQSSNSNRSV